MKKRTKEILKLIRMEVMVLFLFGGAILFLADKLSDGERIITGPRGGSFSVVGALVCVCIFGVAVLVALPWGFLSEMNMSRPERKRRRRQERRTRDLRRRSGLRR